MAEEEEAIIARIITDFEETLSQNQTTPISHSTLLELESLLQSNDPDTLYRFTDQLSSKKLSLSSLIPPISCAMDVGPTNLSLLASKIYLSLLLSPNSPVFTLFTPMAFLSLLRSIRSSLKSFKHVSDSGSHPSVNHKRKGGGRRVQRANEFNEDESEGGFDARSLCLVVEKLEFVVELVYLNRFPDCLKSLIQTVVEIPVSLLELGGYEKLNVLCSGILIKLLRGEHGDVMSTAAEVLKSLVPLILMCKCQARSFALGFLMNGVMGVSKESDGVRKAVVNLPKYLVNKAPEKAELRGLAVEAIMEIVKAMELEDQMRFVEYTVKLTKGKANLRLVAVDLILMLMTSMRDPLNLSMFTTFSFVNKL